jgi:hypothetical protein
MAAQPNPAAGSELVIVFDTKDEAEAMVVKGLLESAGIDSMISNPEVPQDVLPGVGEIVIRVRPDQAEAARNLIAEQRRGMFSQDFSDSDFAEEQPPSVDHPPRQR